MRTQLIDGKVTTQQKCSCLTFLNASQTILSSLFCPIPSPPEQVVHHFSLVTANSCSSSSGLPSKVINYMIQVNWSICLPFLCILSSFLLFAHLCHFCRHSNMHTRKWRISETWPHSHTVFCIFLDTLDIDSTLSSAVSYLCCHMDIGSFLQKQCHHVCVTFLGG